MSETTPNNDTPAPDTAAPVADPLAALGATALGGTPAADPAKPAGDQPATDKDADGKPEGQEGEAEPIVYVLKPPEGFTALDDKALEAATPLLNKLGVKADQAQGIVDEFAKEVLPKMIERAGVVARDQQLEQIVTIRKEWDDARVADKEVGGPDALAKLAVAAKAMDAFGTPELKKLFDETGIGNHPELVRAFYRAGLAIQEGTIHRSDGAEQRKPDDGELFYGDKYKQKVAA